MSRKSTARYLARGPQAGSLQERTLAIAWEVFNICKLKELVLNNSKLYPVF